MQRIVLWFLSTLSTLVLLLGYHTSTSGPAVTAQEPIAATVVRSGGSTTTSGGTGGDDDGTTGTTALTATGDVAQTRWGPVQVEVSTDASGEIVDVQVLQYPNGNGRDVEINRYALPVLVDETISAQSADIDMVSGATVTSEGYLASLQSALDQLGA